MISRYITAINFSPLDPVCFIFSQIRNSWGTDWGDDGYIQLESGENLCDITYIPTFTNAEIVDYDD